MNTGLAHAVYSIICVLRIASFLLVTIVIVVAIAAHKEKSIGTTTARNILVIQIHIGNILSS